MRLTERQSALDAVLHSAQALWHPQPFREIGPQWSVERPDLAAELRAQGRATAEEFRKIDAEALNRARAAERLASSVLVSSWASRSPALTTLL